MAARTRSLDLEPAAARREVDRILALLATEHLTRRQLQERLGDDGLRGERLGHALMLAELEALICSGPLAAGQHTYALLDERAPAAPALDRDEAVDALVARFVAGHGPASVAQLVRWAAVTRREVGAALDGLGDRVERVDIDGVPHWRAADAPVAAPEPGALLLPVFDEAYLTYPGSGFPRSAGHPWGAGSSAFAESGGGVVVSGVREVGWWKRTESGATTRVVLGLDPSLPGDRRRAVEAEAVDLAAHTGRSAEIVAG